MKKVALSLGLLAGAVLFTASASWAQFARYDYMWARSTAGAPLTLDGKMDEPQWAQAESVLVKYRSDAGIPGSGWKSEGGFEPTDSTYAVIKFLTVGNQLWMGARVKDKSIGGSKDFNRFDGLLMSIKNHGNGSHPASAGEHFISWWWPVESLPYVPNPLAVDLGVSMIGEWRDYPPGSPVTPTQLQAWDARATWRGHTNTDAAPDTDWTVEMRCDMPLNGYNITQAAGDIVEFNASLYDCDNFWPTQFFTFSQTRAWIQGPWGNDSWYHNLHVYAKPAVTVNSGAVPSVGPDLIIPNAGSYSPPVIDGNLTDACWSAAPTLKIAYDDTTTRKNYPGVLKWRSGQYEAPVNGNGGTAFVQDPANCTVKYFFKADTLYLGFDFKDAVVQSYSLVDRMDGALVMINDRTKRFSDNNLLDHRISFSVKADGTLQPQDEMANLRDTLHVVRAQLKLKPGTTVDTLGVDTDQGYTVEMAIDLTALGYAPDLGDHALYFGIDVLDGDSYSPITDSYGTRTWFGREFEGRDGPAVAFLDPNSFIVAGADPGPAPAKLALAGNYPNPFRGSTTIRYSLPAASKVRLEVYDLQGRMVSSRDLGLQTAGAREVQVPGFANRPGLYMYRLKVADQATGSSTGTLFGKMMVIR